MMPMRFKRALRTGMAVVLGACLASLSFSQNPDRQLSFDDQELEAVEDLTESLANDLLALSVETRRMNMAAMSGHFAEDLAAEPLPDVAGPVEAGVKWIHGHGWSVSDKWKPAEPEGKKKKKKRRRKKNEPEEPVYRKLDKAEFLGQLEGFLQHFGSIEDARFKVKEATFPDPAVPEGTARLGFFLVGRDSEEHREWVRGSFWVTARREGESWKILTFRTASLDSMLSTKDLFSKVTEPAGIARTYPKFGVPPNDGFTAHGGAVGDANGDGILDLILTEVDGNRLLLGDGKGGFKDVSEDTLVSATPPSTGALFLDVDNDGDQDIFLSAIGKQTLLQHHTDPNGIWTYRDISEQAGVAVSAVGFSATAGDVNNDGFPDIYVSSYNKYGTIMPNDWSRATNGTSNLLFINQGRGVFVESARDWGVDDGRWSYAAAFADVNADGKPDLYVANDFGENALYINQGSRFQDEALRRGVLDPGNGMGVAFGDYDNDGDLDLHVTNMSSTAGNRILGRLMPEAKPSTSVLKKLASGNSLYKNTGNGYFENVSEAAGGFGAGWAYGGGFLDFDNDGWEDEFSVNGFVSGSSMADT